MLFPPAIPFFLKEEVDNGLVIMILYVKGV